MRTSRFAPPSTRFHRHFFVTALLICVLGTALPTGVSAQTFPARWDNNVADILALVSADSLMRRVRELCGLEAVQMNGTTMRITNRWDGFGGEGNELAGDYLEAVLHRYGLRPYAQRFEENGRNVIGLQEGRTHPGQKYIICAHYDAAGFGLPGADDNASGTAAVLEAARLLSQYDLDYTVEYILWDSEERGLVGSHHYAQTARQRGDSIRGVINLDMISWDSDDDARASLEYNNDSGLPLVATMQTVNDTYAVGLDLYARLRQSTPSDNFSFTRFGFPSFLFIEDWSDFNWFYHGIGDAPSEINVPFYTRITQVAIGGLALLAGIPQQLDVDAAAAALPEAVLLTPSPHPFSSLTTLRFSLPRPQHVRIELYDVMGRRVRVVADTEGRAGLQQVHFDASALPAGTYVLRLMTTEETTAIRVLRSR